MRVSEMPCGNKHAPVVEPRDGSELALGSGRGMFLRNFRWLWAVPVLAVIWAMVYLVERQVVEQDLTTRSNAALEAAGLGWAKTSFNGLEGRLDGRAYTEAERSRARDIVSGIWGVWSVDDRTSVIAKRDDYRWSATLARNAVRLAGYYPDPKVRSVILGAVGSAFPDRRVEDRMEPARGGPQSNVLLAGVRFGVDQLRLLRDGAITLSGQKLSIEGEARDVQAYRTVKGALARSMPRDIVLASDKVRPPVVDPYTWTVSRESNQLVFSGHVPDEKGRVQVMEAAKAAFPRLAIVDKMAAAGGAGEGWLDLVSAVLPQLAKLESGSAIMRGTSVVLSGMAVEQETAEAVQSALGKVQGRYRISHDIKYRNAKIPLVTPFVTSVLKEDSRVTLAGYAPSQSDIDRLIAAAKARAGTAQVVSTLQIAKGAPEGWRACIVAGIDGLSRLDSGRAELVARNLQVTGVTRDEETGLALPGIVRAAANRACKDVVEVKIDVPPEPNLKWQAVWKDKRLTLNGQVPDSKLKAELVEQARRAYPGAEIKDEMRVSPGRSQKWPKVASLLVEMLAKLRQGEARIDGQVVSLVGQAADTAAATAVTTRFKRGMSKGYSGEPKIEIRSDAMIWAEQEARRKEEARLQAEKLRREQEEAARRAAAEQTRRAAAEEASRAAAEEARRAAEARRKAEADEAARKKAEAEHRRAEEGRRQAEESRRKAEQEREKAEAAAKARREADERARQQTARPEPPHIKLSPAAQRCQDDMRASILRNRIRFRTNSDQIRDESEATLNQVAQVMKSCATIKVLVAGHTDSRGRKSWNQDLSERRAAAVVKYLISKGIASERLLPQGYGESRPAVANINAVNRAFNRRIEFRIIGE